MQKKLAGLILLGMLTLSGQLFADLPGGMNQFAATVRVYNHEGNPYAGIPVQLFVQTTGPWGSDICVKTGATDAGGWCYLECLVEPEYSEQLDWIEVTITNSYYAIIESENTSSSSSSFIFPVFDIGVDNNLNDIVDVWEMPLAQKFCPVLFQPKDDNGGHWNASGWDYTLRPVPVESMDRDGPSGQPDGILDYHDVDVDVYNTSGQFVGTYDMEDIDVEGTPYSARYPDLIKPYSQISCTPPGKTFSSYKLLPHYEWATTNDSEGNVSWYSEWNDLYYQKGVIGNDTWYVDGTIYVYFEITNTTKLFFGLHYPFNACANRHEGDWPFVVVELDSQDPDGANIVSVDYAFHEESTFRTLPVTYSISAAEALHQEEFVDDGNNNPSFADKYFVVGGTHPVTFGGGRMDEQGIEGWGSHAQYPCPGIWKRFKGPFGSIALEEYVVENGSIANEVIYFDFNNYQNILILPPRQYVVDHLRNDPTYNWAIFGGFWGSVFSYPSADQGTFSDIANLLGDIVTVVFFGIPQLVFPDAFPFVPDVNLAPLSIYGGSLGW